MNSFALVLGESLIDAIGQTECPGGSPMNLAVGLSRLGRPTILATWFATDQRGQAIAAHLSNSGVELLPGSSAASKTSLAKVTLTEDGTANYHFDLEWQLPPLADDLKPLVSHCGSIGAILQPGAEDVLATVGRLKDISSISYDPNLRPQIMGSAAQVRSRVEELAALSDIIKASTEDLNWLYPGTPAEETVQRWSAAGTALVVLTRGEQGCLGLSQSSQAEQPAPTATVIDTVGAGDAFMAGLLHGLWQHNLLGPTNHSALSQLDQPRLSQLLDLASQVAGRTLSRPGADPPWLDDLSS